MIEKPTSAGDEMHSKLILTYALQHHTNTRSIY